MIRKIIFIIILLFLILGSFVFYTNKAFLYSGIPTHYNLTREMIKLYNMTYDPDTTVHQAELIMKGSVDEDTLPRPAFHLYDPVYNRAPFGVYTAKQWALDSGVQKSAIQKFASILFSIFKGKFEYHGDYSWSASVKYFIKDDLDKAYYGLGHILHLIEDMDVPAHTRNDHHLMGDPFEKWAKDSAALGDYDWADKLYNQGYYPKYLYSLDQAFDELAGYSNKYFFSKDTILDDDYDWPRIIKEQSEDYGLASQRWYLWGKDEEGKVFRLAEFSKDLLTNKRNYFIDKTDQKLNSDYWQRLAPRAIIYGAGVIRLFMREIEWEKEKLTYEELEENWFQKAQTFVKGLLGIGGEEERQTKSTSIPQPLPQPKPVRFPDAGPLVIETLSEPIEPVLEEKEEKKPLVPELDKEKGEVKGIQKEGKGQDKGEVKEAQTGSKGESGGISWRRAEEIHEQRVGGSQTPGEQEEQEEEQEQEEEEQEEEPEPEPEPEPGIEPHLVINEIQVRDNEFVELYNPTNSAISLASYSFCYYSKSRDWNDPWRNKVFPEAASISAEGYYLIGLEGYPASSGNPDSDWQVYESNQLSNSAGSIAIFPWDPSERTISEAQAGAIDTVAWGDVENVMEGISFQETISIDKSIQRKDSGQDTNDNNSDFNLQKIPSPINSNGEQRIPGTFIPDDTIISEDTTWTIAGSPYYIELNYNQWPIVEEGSTLTIEPGVVVMPLGGNYTFLEIRGTLIAEGTEDEKIIFTSIKDSDYGGEGSAEAGDWVGMLFTATSIDSSIKNTVFRYGSQKVGLQKLDTEMVKVDNSSIKIENVIMEYGQSRGLHFTNSNSKIENSVFKDSKLGILIEGSSDTSTIEGCSFENNLEFGLYIQDGASPIIEDNEFTNNGQAGSQGAIMVHGAYPEFRNNQAVNNTLNGILVHWQSIFNQDADWEADLPYVLISNKGEYPTVASGSILTLKPGTVLKPYGGKYTALLVEGTLIAEASSGSEIVITSLKDDSWGGDTNNNGNSTIPTNGDWENIIFTSSSQGSVLDHVFLYHGSATPIVIEDGADVEIKDTVDYSP